jgi:hypothetical protein
MGKDMKERDDDGTGPATNSTSAVSAAEYAVTVSREIGGAWREAGTVVRLTAAQAKYYLPPFGTGLAPGVDAASDRRPSPVPSPAPAAAEGNGAGGKAKG